MGHNAEQPSLSAGKEERCAELARGEKRAMEHWADLAWKVAEQHSCSLVKTVPHFTSLDKQAVGWNEIDQKAKFQFALWQEGLATAHKPTPEGTDSDNQPALDGPFHQGKPGVKCP
jgi:hypothetical protein